MYSYSNLNKVKLAKGGAQSTPIGIPITCWKQIEPIEKNECSIMNLIDCFNDTASNLKVLGRGLLEFW